MYFLCIMARIYLTDYTDHKLVFIKSYNKIYDSLTSCNLLPHVIEDIICKYVGINTTILIEQIDMTNYNDKCYCCNNISRLSYVFIIDNQKINNQQVIMYLRIDTCTKYNNITRISIIMTSDNIANITLSSQDQFNNAVPCINTFMKCYYNKQQYISHDYSLTLNNNTYDSVYSITIHNKRLFKNIIVIIKCITSYVQKKLIHL